MAPVKQILEGGKSTSKILPVKLCMELTVYYSGGGGESNSVGTSLCVFVVGEGRRRVTSSIDWRSLLYLIS